MKALLRGALVEYSGNFLGPIPNIVIFQFNPNELVRTINIPSATGGSHEAACADQPQREIGSTPSSATESFTVNALFSAADDLGANNAKSALPRLFGVGPQLAALEKMVYPPEKQGDLSSKAIDTTGSGLGGGPSKVVPVPRESVPKLLFIWGANRVLPVRVKSMTITEKQFDFLLNPVEAEVAIGLDVLSEVPKDEAVAYGALKYTNTLKHAQAALNLANAVEMAADIIPF
jgi:hypothetical protein